MKYPISIQSFNVLREEGFVYVDKTDLVYKLAQNHVCFLCRPRRFGKSLLLSTLKAYFQGKKELFKGLMMESLEHEWKQYPTFHLDFNGVNFHQAGALEGRLNAFISSAEQIYGKAPFVQEFSYGDRLAFVFQQANLQTGLRCVVLIDEYDKPMLDVLGSALEQVNRDILKSFYSVFKLADDNLRFVLLTGVTKFSQVSVFSGFNQPLDISMSPEYETICGITEDELNTCFAESIEQLAANRNMPVEKVKEWLKHQYDGYHFSSNMTDVYNPYSILNVFASGIFRDYWFSSGTPTYLVKLMENNNIDIQAMLSHDYPADYFADYRANTEDPLAMLYQSGYLTIKNVLMLGLDTLYRLDFPNIEVKRGFVSLLYNNYFQEKDYTAGTLRRMVQSLNDADLNVFRDTLTSYLSSIDYEMRKDKEYHFQYTLYLIFTLMSTYNVQVEQHSSQGRADMVVETKDNIYIFEFKLDGTADEALQQIEEKGYATPYLTDVRPIHKIGVSFGKQSGTIDDWKVRN